MFVYIYIYNIPIKFKRNKGKKSKQNFHHVNLIVQQIVLEKIKDINRIWISKNTEDTSKNSNIFCNVTRNALFCIGCYQGHVLPFCRPFCAYEQKLCFPFPDYLPLNNDFFYKSTLHKYMLV